MSRAINDTQKKAIFSNLPSSVTIGSTNINASKIWANQAITSYPTISLNVSTDGIPAVRDVSDGVLYYKTVLTIHILTKNQSSLNGDRIADAFAGSICTELESWVTPLTGDVRLFDVDTDIESIGNLGYDLEVYDYVISVSLYHS